MPGEKRVMTERSESGRALSAGPALAATRRPTARSRLFPERVHGIAESVSEVVFHD